MATKPSRNGHLPINGLSLYHEVYGELGKSKTSPLLLIPGSFMATGSMKALRHPTLVNKLVSLSATYRKDGWYSSVFEGIEGLSAKAFAGTPVEKAFKEHMPDAAAFDAYVEKMKVLGIEDQHISDAQMRSISAKTMVIVGDADAVKPEHALAMFKLRGGGDEEAAASGMLQKVPAARLVILAATSHIGISGESAVLVPMVSAFLDDVPPATPDLF
jgi:pimeloyl-ACP methyl ester carboxylesterase